MKRLTEGKVKLTAPKGYVPPSREELYPPKAAARQGSAPKQGDKQQHAGANYTFDGKQWVKQK
jgi:hypothetical protein